MFVMGCQDAVHSVATAALSAVTTFITEVRDAPEIMALKPVISPMLSVMEKCLREGDEDMFIEGMDVIQECCTLEQPLINDHIEVIVQFIISIISNKEAESSVKKSAGQTLMNIIEYRPKLFAKKNLVAPTMTVLMDMVAKEESSAAGSLFTFAHAEDGVHEEDDDEEYNEEEDEKLDVQRLVQTIIDTMAIHVPSKYFVEPALALCSQVSDKMLSTTSEIILIYILLI